MYLLVFNFAFELIQVKLRYFIKMIAAKPLQSALYLLTFQLSLCSFGQFVEGLFPINVAFLDESELVSVLH